MSAWTRMGAVALALAVFAGGAAYAQAPNKAADCPPKGAAERVEGQVVKVDPTQGKVTIKTGDGTTHDFQASKETLQDMKVGDKVAAKLRVSENCKRS